MTPSLPTAIFQPVAFLVFWTLSVLLLVPFARFRAGAKREVVADDFRYGESERVPDHVRLPNRNFMNLLEVPVLFYVGCLVTFISQHVEPTLLTIAWVYVALRAAHSVVHLSYNHVMQRMALFAISNVVLTVFWGRLCWLLWA